MMDLNKFSNKVFSQNGEDGIIEKIFETIGTTNKYYVEFGGGIGFDNTRALREQKGWTGLLLNGGLEDPNINLHKEFVTAENINDLFRKYDVPTEFDFLSIDIDYNDWHVWRELSYRPRVVCVEVNTTWTYDIDKVVPYHPDAVWDATDYYSGTPLAFYLLAQQKDYTFVCLHTWNAFFIRNDCIGSHDFLHANCVEKLHANPLYCHRPDTYNRPWESAEQLLQK